MSPGTTFVPPTPPLFDEARLAVAGFLARYSGPTRKSVRRPKIDTESTTLDPDRMELGAFIAQGAAARRGRPRPGVPARPARVAGSEALNIDIEHLAIERGHRTVTVLGKGSKLAVIPFPPKVGRAVDLAAGERSSGPLLRGASRRADRRP